MTFTRSQIGLSLFLAGLLLLSSCQTTPPRYLRIESPPAQPVSEADLLRRLQFSPDQFGYLVYDLDADRVVASHGAEQEFLPASTGKIATTLAALEVLGAGYRFRTRLAYRGRWKDGTLQGDLFLKGGGDPMLTVPGLFNLAETLQRHPARAVTGRFFFDSSDLTELTEIEPEQEMDAVYNTSVGALSAEFNRLRLAWSVDSRHGSLAAFTVPQLPLARLELPPPETAAKSGFDLRLGPDSDTWILPTRLTPVGQRELPVHHAGLYTAQLFAKLCGDMGLDLSPPQAGTLPLSAREIAVQLSAPLWELVSRNLEYSNNLMAELFLTTAARKLTARTQSLSDAAMTVSRWIEKRISGVSWAGYRAVNGSGLSSDARISPAQAVAILKWADRRKYAGKSYQSLLPISGWKGTLRNRLLWPPTALKIWAKTGTMKFGSSLAGYFYSEQKHKNVFAIFVSAIDRRNALDRAAASPDSATFRELSEAGDAWIARARQFQDQMLMKWMREN